MSARDPDELLKDGGGEVGDLYRRLPRYEPPRRLDRAVLNEAARAVLSGRPPRRQRWIVGIGSAAGLVLAAGLAWRIGHEPMGASDAVAPTAAPRVVPVQPIDESTRARRDTPAREEIAPKPAEAPPSAEQRSAPAAGNERQKASRKQRAEHKPPPPVPMQAEEPPPAPPAAAAPQPFSANEQEVGQAKDAEKSESASDAAGRASSGLVTKPVTSTKMRPLSPTVPSSSVELQRDMQLAPADWLAHIRDLMRQGRRQQAIESLRLFVRAHPDERVPADLRELLE
jgi:hypothetical protein